MPLYYIARIGNPKVAHAVQVQALKLAARDIQKGLRSNPVFKGTARRYFKDRHAWKIYPRRVKNLKIDDVKMTARLSILGGKGGFVNRWINRGTDGHREGRGRNPGFTGKNIFVEDIDAFNELYDKYLAQIFETL